MLAALLSLHCQQKHVLKGHGRCVWERVKDKRAPQTLVQGQREMEDIPLPAFVGLFLWKSCGCLTKTYVSVAKGTRLYLQI